MSALQPFLSQLQRLFCLWRRNKDYGSVMSPTPMNEKEARVTVSIPQMFKNFLVHEPEVNPYLEKVGLECEDWLQRAMCLSPKQQQRVVAGHFPYFCGVLIPEAEREELRIVTDYFLWVFIFDDMFDDGELRNDPVTSQRIVTNLLSVMVPELKRTSVEPIVTAHDDIYYRFIRTASENVQRRYVQYMKHYCAGCLQHVEDYSTDRTPTIQEMLDTRRMSIGVYPMYPLVEWAYGLDIPDEVFDNVTIQTLENLGCEFVMLMNDVLSYRKEEKQNCPFNVVAVSRMRGASAQEAFDEIAAMIDSRFDLWDEAVKTLPSWGKEVDEQVHKYIVGVQNLVQANLSWSFRTKRYFGENADSVRQNRQIDVLIHPPFCLPDENKVVEV